MATPISNTGKEKQYMIFSWTRLALAKYVAMRMTAEMLTFDDRRNVYLLIIASYHRMESMSSYVLYLKFGLCHANINEPLIPFFWNAYSGNGTCAECHMLLGHLAIEKWLITQTLNTYRKSSSTTSRVILQPGMIKLLRFVNLSLLPGSLQIWNCGHIPRVIQNLGLLLSYKESNGPHVKSSPCALYKTYFLSCVFIKCLPKLSIILYFSYVQATKILSRM